MKKFDWKDLLKRHTVFSSLSDKDIEHLIKDDISEEKNWLQGEEIIREGDRDDSVFLIGSGSVRVVLKEKGDRGISLSTLGKGEVFGEMSLIEKRPRLATVIAEESSTLLEVKGQEFLKIMEENADIAFKVLLKMSERLRHVNDQLLGVRLMEVDEKINLFNTKLDSELKAVEASLKASQAVFDQTKMRTDEVINSAERSRARIVATATVIGIIITGIASFSGVIGFKKFGSLKGKLETAVESVADDLYTVNKLSRQAMDDVKEIGRIRNELGNTEQFTEGFKELADDTRNIIADHFILPQFRNALKTKRSADDIKFYEALRDLSPEYLNINILLFDILAEIENGDTPTDYTDILWLILEDAKQADNPVLLIVINAYSLSLANAILMNKHDQEEYDETLSNFREYVETKKEQLKDLDSDLISKINELFQKQDTKKKEEWFGTIGGLIP